MEWADAVGMDDIRISTKLPNPEGFGKYLVTRPGPAEDAIRALRYASGQRRAEQALPLQRLTSRSTARSYSAEQ
jgi:hypothetical protein